MKNFKKLIACVMAVATLGSVACIPVNAEVNNTSTIISQEDIDNAIDVAIINLDGRKFVVNARHEIISDVLVWEPNEEDFESGLVSDKLNAITNIINAELSEDGTYSIVLDREYCYQMITYSAETGEWTYVNEVVQKPLADDEYLNIDGTRYKLTIEDGETYVTDLTATDDSGFTEQYILNANDNVMYYYSNVSYQFHGWDEDGFPIITGYTSIAEENNKPMKYQAYNMEIVYLPFNENEEYHTFADRHIGTMYDDNAIYLTNTQENSQEISLETRLVINPYNNEKYEVPPYYKVIGWFSNGQPMLIDTFQPDYSDDVYFTENGINKIIRNKYQITEKNTNDDGITTVTYIDENYPNKVFTYSYGVQTFTLYNGETLTSDEYGIFTKSNGDRFILGYENQTSSQFTMIYDKNGEFVCISAHFMASDIDTIEDNENTTQNEISLGESATGIRGDIDYDGDVDAVDLLLLKKYLLQMITW